MKKIGYLLCLLLFSTVLVAATPDCIQTINLTATGRIGFDNRITGCTSWTFVYTAQGFTSVFAEVDYAPDAGGTPGVYSIWPIANTGPGAAQPLSSITSGQISVFKYQPWVSINTTVSGTGTLLGLLVGWKPGPGQDAAPPFRPPIQSLGTSYVVVTSNPVFIKKLVCSNILGNGGGSVNITISDTATTPNLYVNNFNLTGGSIVEFVGGDGLLFSGIKWLASVPNSVNCQVSGYGG